MFCRSDAICSHTFGKASKTRESAVKILLFGCFCQAIVLGILFPSFLNDVALPSAWTTIIFGALLWGVGDAACNTMITVLLLSQYQGTKRTISFSQFKFWQSLATSISFFCSPYLTSPYVSDDLGMKIKCVIAGVFCFLSMYQLISGRLHSETRQSLNYAGVSDN